MARQEDPDYEVHDMGRSGSFRLSANQWGHYERMHTGMKLSARQPEQAKAYSSNSRAIAEGGKKTRSGSLSQRGIHQRHYN